MKHVKLDDLSKELVYYMACPYTAINANSPNHRESVERIRYIEITTIGAQLTKEGLVLLTPITVSHKLKKYEPTLGTTWDYWKRIDTKLLERCADAVIVAKMPGWEKSVGVAGELEIARRLKIPIFYLDPHDFEVLELEEV